MAHPINLSSVSPSKEQQETRGEEWADLSLLRKIVLVAATAVGITVMTGSLAFIGYLVIKEKVCKPIPTLPPPLPVPPPLPDLAKAPITLTDSFVQTIDNFYTPPIPPKIDLPPPTLPNAPLAPPPSNWLGKTFLSAASLVMGIFLTSIYWKPGYDQMERNNQKLSDETWKRFEENESLRKKFQELDSRYSSLSQEHTQLSSLSHNGGFKKRYEDLFASHSSLAGKLNALQRDASTTRQERDQLAAQCEKLRREHSLLSSLSHNGGFKKQYEDLCVSYNTLHHTALAIEENRDRLIEERDQLIIKHNNLLGTAVAIQKERDQLRAGALDVEKKRETLENDTNLAWAKGAAGVARDSSCEDAMKSFRQLAFMSHSDRNPQNKTFAEAHMRQLSRAKEILENAKPQPPTS